MSEQEKEILEEVEETTQADIAGEENIETKEADGAEEMDNEETASDSGETPEKKSKFFKKDKKKDKKDEQIAMLNDKVVRQMAEFDNYRKRTEKEKTQMYEVGASDVIEKILPVIDNFERGIQAMTDEDKASSFAQGMEMIYKQLLTTLEGLGVTAIEAVGKEFDPAYHNAVMQAPSEEYESGVVTQELQKGYIYKERVVRHSMVMVAE